jgi:hypothetical protein
VRRTPERGGTHPRREAAPLGGLDETASLTNDAAWGSVSKARPGGGSVLAGILVVGWISRKA